jgi:hypothetical protein
MKYLLLLITYKFINKTHWQLQLIVILKMVFVYTFMFYYVLYFNN